MTVQELIEVLKTMPTEADVTVLDPFTDDATKEVSVSIERDGTVLIACG